MKKKLLCLVMGLVMLAGSSLTVFAEDYQGRTDLLAEFTGDEIRSNYSRSDFTDEFSQVQPGDSVQMNIAIRNSDDSETDWYMTNEIIETLEDAMSSAEGGAYEYRLSYTDKDGAETVLYDSDTVGGETAAGGLEGLHEFTGAADEYFFLDRLASGESGRVNLWIRVDGETQGNGYQLTLAELRVNFAVEKVPEAERRTVVNRTTSDSDIRVVTTVQTGDAAKLMLWSGVALGCGLVLVAAAVWMRKKNNGKGE